MRSCLVRCKHCGKEYSWRASGEGCFERLNSPDYCPECMEAILKALSGIPIHYEKRLNETEVPDERVIGMMKALVDERKTSEEYAKRKGLFCVNAMKFMYFPDEVKTAAEFSIDWIHYLVESPSDDIFDKDASWFREDEYDLIEKRFTGRPWKSDERESYNPLSVGHFMKSEDFESRGMCPPSGQLLFMDFKK